MSPALEKILAAKRANPYRSNQSVAELREEHAAGARAVPLPEGTEITTVDAGGTPAEWVRAPGAGDARADTGADTGAAFLFIHGGGYYRGSAEGSRGTTARLSAATGAPVLSIDYRLAPEHPFPAALDDTLAAYRWLVASGWGPQRLVVGGVSAGGGLTLALLLAVKAAGEALPAAAVPLSPWTDLTQSGASFRANAETDVVISKAYLDRMAGYYLAGADGRSPLASPLYGDLEGLPPLLIQVGLPETMLDDSVAFAHRAEAAGVFVSLERWPEMFHGWHGSAHALAEAQQAIDRIGEFFRAHVSR